MTEALSTSIDGVPTLPMLAWLPILASLLVALAALAWAGEGGVKKIELLKERESGLEFIFVWSDVGGFCLRDPLNVTVIVQPDGRPEAFHFDSRSVTLRLHRATLAKAPQLIDSAHIAELCD